LSEKKILLGIVAALATGLVIVSTLSPYAGASTLGLENATLLTPNEIAAGGPIPPNYTLAQQEAECVAAEENAPWYPTMLSYEHHDSTRSHLYDCATFPGSFTGPNQVYAYRSPERYYTPSMMATRGINEMYVYGGASYNAVPTPSGSFVARVEPGSLKELWRTDLVNTNISGIWTGAGSIESIDSDILAITNTYLFRLNGTTGQVEAVQSLPTGASLPNNSYFNGMSGWPDGTLVMKNLARAPGCTLQGFFALSNCPNLDQTPPSTMVAVDSNTLKVLDWVQLEEMIGGRITATQYDGHNYAYVAGQTNLYRYEWNGQNLTLDESWGPVSYLLPGQTSASAAGIMGDWVILMTNGGGTSNVPLSIIAISQANSSQLTRIEPMPLKPGQVSYIPSMPAIDLENNRLYAMDPGPGKTVGIDFDQATGNMSVAWSADQSTLSWLVLIDDAANRVLVGTNISTNITNPLDLQVGPKGANYVEQIQWRNADTGKLLAASDFFSPMIVGMQVWAGYGGLIYEGLNEGNIMALKVLPATNATSASVNATTNSTTSATSPTSETTIPAST
jgi:hypothetical protein